MIRLATVGDAPQIAEIYRPFCVDNAISFETEAPDGAEMAARIEAISSKYPWLVDVENGVVKGYAYASAHRARAAYRWAVEVTVYVSEKHRGTGVGRALDTELFERLRAQRLFLAYAGILVPNPASQAFHESMGFTLVGIYRKIGYKLGAWRDVGWWELALQPQLGNPPDPLPPRSHP
jgi:L-amino acid N-acyltransferase YncA